MPAKPPTPCTRCGKPAVTGGKCAHHARQTDLQRGTATQRGYHTEGHRTFRQEVLNHAGWVCIQCGQRATVADHHPTSRRNLITQGLNPDNPTYGRALCKRCHDQHTGRTQGAGALERHQAPG